MGKSNAVLYVIMALQKNSGTPDRWAGSSQNYDEAKERAMDWANENQQPYAVYSVEGVATPNKAEWTDL